MADKLEDFLAHYGIPGMKWGRRKGRGSGPSSDHREVSSLRKKKRSELSTAELKKINERLQLEKKNSELSNNPISLGHKKVTAILALAGTATAAYNLANSPMAKAGAAAVKTAIKASYSNTGRHVLVNVAKTGAKHL